MGEGEGSVGGEGRRHQARVQLCQGVGLSVGLRVKYVPGVGVDGTVESRMRRAPPRVGSTVTPLPSKHGEMKVLLTHLL